MNIKFDKVFIVSYVYNSDKRKIISNKLIDLGITEFEFMYGFNAYDNNVFNTIEYNTVHKEHRYYMHGFSCTMAHLNCVELSLAENYNNILIIEDDCLFIDDMQYIIDHLNNYPGDADIVRYGYCMLNDKYENGYTIGKNNWFAGTQMYVFCNRNIMEYYVKYMHTKFYAADEIMIHLSKEFKIYSLYPRLAVDTYYHNNEHDKNIYTYY